LASRTVLAGHAGVIDVSGAPVRPTVGTSGLGEERFDRELGHRGNFHGEEFGFSPTQRK
jgi:hypothetical protein